MLREIPGIEAFRITQKRLTYFEVEIVRNQHYDRASEGRIQEAFAGRLRAPVAVQVRYLSAIASTASGKARHVISEINPPPGVAWPSSQISNAFGGENAASDEELRTN